MRWKVLLSSGGRLMAGGVGRTCSLLATSDTTPDAHLGPDRPLAHEKQLLQAWVHFLLTVRVTPVVCTSVDCCPTTVGPLVLCNSLSPDPPPNLPKTPSQTRIPVSQCQCTLGWYPPPAVIHSQQEQSTMLHIWYSVLYRTRQSYWKRHPESQSVAHGREPPAGCQP